MRPPFPLGKIGSIGFALCPQGPSPSRRSPSTMTIGFEFFSFHGRTGINLKGFPFHLDDGSLCLAIGRGLGGKASDGKVETAVSDITPGSCVGCHYRKGQYFRPVVVEKSSSRKQASTYRPNPNIPSRGSLWKDGTWPLRR